MHRLSFKIHVRSQQIHVLLEVLVEIMWWCLDQSFGQCVTRTMFGLSFHWEYKYCAYTHSQNLKKQIRDVQPAFFRWFLFCSSWKFCLSITKKGLRLLGKLDTTDWKQFLRWCYKLAEYLRWTVIGLWWLWIPGSDFSGLTEHMSLVYNTRPDTHRTYLILLEVYVQLSDTHKMCWIHPPRPAQQVYPHFHPMWKSPEWMI